jgi:hypothetical protein
MLKRLKAAWACLCLPEGPRGSYSEPRDKATPDVEPEATLTPAECRVIFDFVQVLLMSWAVKLFPEFDPNRVQAADPEIYWKMIDFGVSVEKIERPVRAEAFRWFLTEYSKAVSDATIISRNAMSGA